MTTLAIEKIRKELVEQIAFFERSGKLVKHNGLSNELTKIRNDGRIGFVRE